MSGAPSGSVNSLISLQKKSVRDIGKGRKQKTNKSARPIHRNGHIVLNRAEQEQGDAVFFSYISDETAGSFLLY